MPYHSATVAAPKAWTATAMQAAAMMSPATDSAISGACRGVKSFDHGQKWLLLPPQYLRGPLTLAKR